MESMTIKDLILMVSDKILNLVGSVYPWKQAREIKASNEAEVKKTLSADIVEYINVNLFPSILDLKIKKNVKKDRVYQVLNLTRKGRDLEFVLLENKLRKYLKKSSLLSKFGLRGETKKFSRLMSIMLRKSHAIRVRAVYKTIPSFHTKYKWEYILSQIRIASKLMTQDDFNYNYKRIWIPKPNGKGMRPLSAILL